MPVEAKREQNNSLKAQNTAQSQKSKKGFQPKKKQHTTASQKPPGVKRLRGKGKYYKAFGIDMRAASAHLPDNEGAYGYVEKDSLLTCLDPVAGLFFAGDLPWECICDMWLYFRTTNSFAIEKHGFPSTLVKELRNYKQYQFYIKQLEPLFVEFMSLDVDYDKPLFLCFIYPNGDELHIRRLYGDELKMRAPLKFLTVFVR